MELFEKYMSNMYLHQQKLYEVLIDEIDKIIGQGYDFTDSLFDTQGDAVKMLLQSNKWLFWAIWDYLEGFNINEKSDQEEVNILQTNGIYIAKSLFNASEVSELLIDWKNSMKNVPEVSDVIYHKSLLNRFYFESNNNIGYAVGSIHDGKKRALFYDKNSLPEYFDKHLRKNDFLNTIVKKYYNFKRELEPDVVMAEHLYSPKYYRDNEAWHIDNLSDQFKVMIVLEDMTVDDAPFTYVEQTHKVNDSFKDRYHKMFATNGMTTQEQNHFEKSFTKTSLAKQGILSAGDAILFDCRIHHTATFAKNGGDRKNVVLYYTAVPTVKNKFLFKIDKYLNFGLK